MMRQEPQPTDLLAEQARLQSLCRTCKHTEVCATADLIRLRPQWHLSFATCTYYDEDPRALTDEDRALAQL